MKDTYIGTVAGLCIGIFAAVSAHTIAPDFFLDWWVIVAACAIFAGVGVRIAGVLSNRIPSLFEMAKFALVGVLNTAVDIGVLNICILISGVSEGVWFSVFKAFSFLVAVANSYLWNAIWTFRSSATFDARAFKFIAVSVIGFAVNVGVASLLVNGIQTPFALESATWANVASLIASVCGMAWNFIGYKIFVFKKSIVESNGN